MKKSGVGRTWCSLITWPGTFIAGGFSIFGFSNTGGAIGAAIGSLVGGIVSAVGGFAIAGILGAALGVMFGAYLGGFIGGAIGWLIDKFFSGATARIWLTAHPNPDDSEASWVIPDIPISQGGHTKTSNGPALAEFNGKLYLAYKANSNNSIRYNVFDGMNMKWLDEDKEVEENGNVSRTSEKPALAVYNGKLYLAYKAASNNNIRYNVFNGMKWLDGDKEVEENGNVSRTNKGPALAVYKDKLYLAYKAASNNNIRYNVFNGMKWLDGDKEVSQEGHTKTNKGPALAAYDGTLYLAYKASKNNNIWCNEFDGSSWRKKDIKITQDGHVKTGRSPALATFAAYLVMVYRDGS